MCGFFGMISSENHIAPQLYEGLVSLQHRGQNAAGIITFDGFMNLKKGNGLVNDVFDEEDIKRLRGNVGIGHVRYPTVGNGGVNDAQPFSINYPYGIAMVHNGNTTNYSELLNELKTSRKAHINSNSDLEIILNYFAISLGKMGVPDLTPEILFSVVKEIFSKVKGSYSVLTLIANYGLLAFRDPWGIKPMIYGQRGSDYAIASENIALDILGFTKWTDIKPGEAILFRENKNPIKQILKTQEHHPCIFEHIYFARPDTTMDGISVYKTRRRFGMELAKRWKETDLHADVVIPVPDSACTAALVLARQLGIEYREGLVKNRYIGRTFIMDNNKRNCNIRRKLNIVNSEFKNKNVLLVDDSIVRGNTSKQIIKLARKTGANKVYFASCSPPIRHPCIYGIDMSTKKELIAQEKSTDQVCETIGADYLIYAELKDIISAVNVDGSKVKNFCHACFSGNYPTEDITPEMFTAIEKERLGI